MTILPPAVASRPGADRARALPPGLRLQEADARLERVESRASSLALIARGRGLELVHGRLRAGERLTFVPAVDDAGPFEVAYVTSGVLAHVSGGPTVGPGGSIASDGLDAPTSFEALGDVEFLYVSSAPTSHHLSGDLRELRRLALAVEATDGDTADRCERL